MHMTTVQTKAVHKTLIALTIAAFASLAAFAPTDGVRAQKGVPPTS